MTDKERIQRHDDFIQAQGTLMLATIGEWQGRTAGDFREFLDGAFQIAWRAVYRQRAEDLALLAQAERTVGNYELLAAIRSGKKVN